VAAADQVAVNAPARARLRGKLELTVNSFSFFSGSRY
jgi:hypothetical protein